nr:class I SAM-dependent methyltransferase [Paenibacillus phyllosphaerae]
MQDYRAKFQELASQYDHTPHHAEEMGQVIDEYARFVTDPCNAKAWLGMEQQQPGAHLQLAAELRRLSAACVALMEKYRAWKVIQGDARIGNYFNNIENCIEQEFGSFKVTSSSKVLLVGSGAFPMTPLLIARRTGAEVVGIDIDEEAVDLGRRIVGQLGGNLKIRLEHVPVERLDFTKQATHIIFSSTVSVKYDLLDRLHPLTSDQVVVAMRFGDRLKSIFNYPMESVDERKWKLAETVVQPDQVFDIALYAKASGEAMRGD